MRGIRIKDNTNHALEVELRDVLRVIECAATLRDKWKIVSIDFTVGYGTAKLNRIRRLSPDRGETGQFSFKQRTFSRRELEALAADIYQTISCEIIAYKSTPRGKRKALIISKPETSWWDVMSVKIECLANFKTQFLLTEEITE